MSLNEENNQNIEGIRRGDSFFDLTKYLKGIFTDFTDILPILQMTKGNIQGDLSANKIY